MKCARCGARFAKKAEAAHALITCPLRKKYRGGWTSQARAATSTAAATQLDLFEDFAARGLAAQRAIDAIITKRGTR